MNEKAKILWNWIKVWFHNGFYSNEQFERELKCFCIELVLILICYSFYHDDYAHHSN